MGIQERDYFRRRENEGRPSLLGQLTPVVKALLMVNALVSLLDFLIFPLMGFPPQFLIWHGAFSIETSFHQGQLWQLFTFQYLHGSVGHLFLNAMGIFFFGPWLERWWGSVRFYLFYSLCGVAGAIFYTFLAQVGIIREAIGTSGAWVPVTQQLLVGASAGIYGILIGVAFVAPALRVRLLIPPVTLTMRNLAIGLMLLSVVLIAFSLGGNEGGEAGHLGGALMGLLLMKFPQLLKGWSNKRQIHTNASGSGSGPAHVDEEEVNEILDKINREGIHRLSEHERMVLKRAAEEQRNR